MLTGSGNPYAKLLILTDFPRGNEEKFNRFLSSSYSYIFDDIFKELGYEDWRSEFWVTGIYKHRIPNNKIKRASEIVNHEEQISILSNELNDINPNCILALGSFTLKVLTGYDKIYNYRGSILQDKERKRKVIATIHPCKLIKVGRDSEEFSEDDKLLSYVWRQVLKHDIERAINESRSDRFDLPSRNLQIARSSVDVYRFIERNKGRDRVQTDIETFRSTLPSCVGLAFDKYEGLSIPMFQSLGGVKLCSIPHSDLAHIWSMLDNLFKNISVAGQNFKFDQYKLEMLGFIFKGLKSDTMLKAHTINPEMPSKGLAFLASIYSKEPYYKSEGKEFLYGKHSIDKLYLYNAKDCTTTAEIDDELEKELYVLSDKYHTNLVDFYYNYIIKLHPFYFELEKTGFRIDSGQRHYLIDKYEAWHYSLQLDLDIKIGRFVNFNSPKQVAELIYEQMNIKPLNKECGTDEDTISKLLKDKVKDDERRGILTKSLEIKRVRKTLSTYLYANTDYDGRMRTQVRITGTETGRSSNSTLSEPTRPYDCGFAFQTLTKHGDIGQDIRSYLIADEGYVYINIDLGQAEARVVGLLSSDYEFLKAMDYIDIHRRMAACALITGKLNLSSEFDPIADIIGKNSGERFIGKKAKHATNYNMGYLEFLKQVVSDSRKMHIDIDISPYSAKQILERIHAATPNVRAIFHTDIRNCIDTQRALVNPFGRLRRFFNRPGESLYKEAFAFIPQSTVKDRLTQSGIKIQEKKYPIKLQGEAHDSLTYQMPIGEYLDISKEIKLIMEEEIDFANCSLSRGKLIIPCEFEVGTNFNELEKLKL